MPVRSRLAEAVQHRRDTFVCYFKQKTAYEIDDIGIRDPSIVTSLVLLDCQLSVIAALPVDDEFERIAYIHDDLCDEQPDDLLLRLGGCAWTVPCTSKVSTQPHQSFTIG